ncbi:hypothetical protein [Agrococcus sp. Marseille-Q4369]|uniref:hypothetical protein n=1 Tax=Agrococcus sp. Marseille-Q4369 TaxID=2810513 RepID=UPI001B8C379C|nr:hypothetical protein [Agrococcus sp. Marseille-Q4369]QUW17670.1 hypothetical protein JSQ78_07165 [Agrococcus sp. Marseille-Q4369]
MADSPIRDGGDQPLDDEPKRPDGTDPLDTVPVRRGGDHPPEDDRQLPAGGEPGLPYPNAGRDGQSDFVADATGERFERTVDEGLERIDEHRARIEELEAEQPGAAVGSSGSSGSSLQPGAGAPDVPGGPVGSGDAGVTEPDSVAPDPTAPGAPTAPAAPQGPGTLDPAAPVGDPAGDASALDDIDRAQP